MDRSKNSEALVVSSQTRVSKIASQLIRTPMDLADRMRELRDQAHLITPAMNVAAIPEHIAINPVVVVVDTTFDPKTGRGNDVYFQKSIHKSEKRGRGDDAEWTPLEVSLNATTIKRIIGAAGVNVVSSHRTDPGTIANYWCWESRGKVRDFDGSWRDLPPGNVEIDLRDGSAQIGEFTSEAWKRREVEADKRKQAARESERWKIKPEPIGGWTGDRVMSARRFGLRMAEAKSLNALGRNLGLKQIYSIDELQKPFVIFRATFMPDMSDAETRRMIVAAELGALDRLYPPQPSVTVPALPAAEETPAEDPVAEDPATTSRASEAAASTSATTTSTPQFDQVPATQQTAPASTAGLYSITAVQKVADREKFYILTAETGDQRLHTEDGELAMAALRAKDRGPIVRLKLQEEEDPETKALAMWVVTLEVVAASTTPSPSTSAAAPAAPAGACFVEKIDERRGTTKGRDWTLWTIAFSTGEEAKTFSGSIANDAEAAKKDRLPVRVKLEPSERYPDQLDLISLEIVDTRQRSFLESEL